MADIETDTSLLAFHHLVTLCSVPMCLQAAVRLRVFDILAKADKTGSSQLSAQEIMVRMPSSNPKTSSAAYMDGILRVLASHSILTSSLVHEDTTGGRSVRRYGLGKICKYLVEEEDKTGESQAPLVLLHHHEALMKSFQFLDGAVLNGEIPFQRAHGKSSYDYAMQDDSSFGALLNSAMAGMTKLEMMTLLDSYRGFDQLSTLVDVGGGTGSALSMIVSRHRHIQGTNFDLPPVVASAPSYEGVKHVGGDMFDSVPSGDAIMIKNTLHNWSNESCVKILKNCYKALPAKGKVIVIELMLGSAVETSRKARVASNMNVCMWAFAGGQERTQEEYEELASAGGFCDSKIICDLDTVSVMELFKA